MNDIEVLEELGGKYIANKIIERSKKTDIIYLTKDTVLNTNCVKQLAEYLENLLKERQSDKERIKDLEEINEAHKKENGELRERVNKQALLKEKIIALLKGE